MEMRITPLRVRAACVRELSGLRKGSPLQERGSPLQERGASPHTLRDMQKQQVLTSQAGDTQHFLRASIGYEQEQSRCGCGPPPLALPTKPLTYRVGRHFHLQSKSTVTFMFSTPPFFTSESL
jgi:hypothetical protein